MRSWERSRSASGSGVGSGSGLLLCDHKRSSRERVRAHLEKALRAPPSTPRCPRSSPVHPPCRSSSVDPQATRHYSTVARDPGGAKGTRPPASTKGTTQKVICLNSMPRWSSSLAVTVDVQAPSPQALPPQALPRQRRQRPRIDGGTRPCTSYSCGFWMRICVADTNTQRK